MKLATTALTTLVIPAFALIGGSAPADARPLFTIGSPQVWLTVDEARDLTFLREEEKLARDVYLVLEAQWGLAVFGNIARSEQTHTDAVLGLLNTYHLPDPVGGQPVGVFTSSTLQKLFDQLVAAGRQSQEQALLVGATIEDLDLADLEEMTARTRKPDLLQVYANLSKGSRNHLRAFTRQLSAAGVSYAPQFIDQATYDAIVGTGSEAGPADPGQGAGRGAGRGGKGSPR